MEDPGGMDDGERDDGGRVEAYCVMIASYGLFITYVYDAMFSYLNEQLGWIKFIPYAILFFLLGTFKMRQIRA